MRLVILVRAEWLVVTPLDSRGECPVHRFFETLERDAPSDFHEITARLTVPAGTGRIRDVHKSRHLTDGVFELKTRGGVRLLYFVEDDHVIVCTDVLRKPKPRQLNWLVKRAVSTRAAQRDGRRRGRLEIVED